MKIIPFYLPQFHTFPENDRWWGKGFTEWTNTKKAVPLFEGHYQPHTPYRNNYYDLMNPETMKSQVKIAREYGIYGFCFYHYWFEDGKLLMEKPVERFLEDKTLDFHFCLSWANEHWTRAWDGGEREIIMRQEYGDRSIWEKHFYYLLPFFQDERYIYYENQPLLVIYRPEIIPCFNEMIACWRELAEKHGLPGLFVVAQGTVFCMQNHRKKQNKHVDAFMMYEPGYTYASVKLSNRLEWPLNLLEYRDFASQYLLKKIRYKYEELTGKTNTKPVDICDFSLIWNTILKHRIPEDFFPGAFCGWDNSARRGAKGRIITGSTPELFEFFLEKQIKRARDEYHKDIIFFTAWNEWAEGSHLEPDEKYGFQYLQAVKNALFSTGEWPY